MPYQTVPSDATIGDAVPSSATHALFPVFGSVRRVAAIGARDAVDTATMYGVAPFVEK